MSILSPLIAREWDYFQNTEPVTLFRKTADGQFDAGTQVANALRTVIQRELSGGGKAFVGKSQLDWLLWEAQTAYAPPLTGNPIPKIGDVIQDATGTRWTIWKVDVQAWGGRFQVQTVQER